MQRFRVHVTVMDFRWLLHILLWVRAQYDYLTMSLSERRQLGGICHTAQLGLAQLGLTWTSSECGEL